MAKEKIVNFELQYFENGKTHKVQIRWKSILGCSKYFGQQWKAWLTALLTATVDAEKLQIL